MRRLHRRQLTYGFGAGVFAFGLLWLLALLILTEESPANTERWRATLWFVLGMHFVDLSAIHVQNVILGPVDVATIFPDTPLRQLRALPPVLVAAGAYYAGANISRTRRFRYIVENAATVLLGYLSAFVVAFHVSEMYPSVQTVVTLALMIPVALYVGSMVIGASTGGLAFFGIASLRTVLLLGLFVIFTVVFALEFFGYALLQMAAGILVGAVALYTRRTGAANAFEGISDNAIGILLFVLLAAGIGVALMDPSAVTQFWE